MENEKSLIFSQSPLCPLAADVISDGQSIYMYVYELDFKNEQLVAHSGCWIKNLVDGKERFDLDEMEEGTQPVLPQCYCFAHDHIEWLPAALEVVWSPSGEIAGLYHNEELICVMPYTKDQNSSGFSKYVKENSLAAMKLEEGERYIKEVEMGKTFWKQEFNLEWKIYNNSYFEDLNKRFGKAKQCFDLNKDEFPTRLLLTFVEDEITYAFSIGCGMFSMPRAYTCYEKTKDAKAEFVVATNPQHFDEDQLIELYSTLAGLCGLPWHNISCIAHGHTLDMPMQSFPYAIVIDDAYMKEPIALDIKKQGVHLLWIAGISQQEFVDAHDKMKREALIQHIIETKRYIM